MAKQIAKSRTGPKEIVRDISNDLVRMVASVRALWFAVLNEPDKSVQDMSAEFFDAVGKLLEGWQLSEIELHTIDPKRVFPHIKDG